MAQADNNKKEPECPRVVVCGTWAPVQCEKKVKTQEAAAVKTLIVFKAQFLLSVCHSFALLHGWFKDQQQQKQE